MEYSLLIEHDHISKVKIEDLLPFTDSWCEKLIDLQRKKDPNEQDEFDKQRIISVYENYHFDTKTSEILIGSNILELINESFKTLAACSSENNYEIAQKKLVRFILEHKRLSDKWNFVGAN